MKMRRLFDAVVLSGLVLTACGGSNAKPEPSSSGPVGTGGSAGSSGAAGAAGSGGAEGLMPHDGSTGQPCLQGASDPRADLPLDSCAKGQGHLAEAWAVDNVHGAVVAAAIHGATVALSSADHSVKRWDLNEQCSSEPSYGTPFADQAPELITRLSYGTNTLWGGSEKGNLLSWGSAGQRQTYIIGGGSIGAVTVDESGELVAAALVNAFDGKTIIRIVDSRTGTVTDALTTGLMEASALAFGQGHKLATAGHFYGIPRVELRSTDQPSAIVSQWEGLAKKLSGSVQAMTFNPDATRLFAVGTDFVAVLSGVDLAAPPIAESLLQESTHNAVAVALTENGEGFATVGSEGTVRLWKTDGAALVTTLPVPGPAVGIGVFNHQLLISGADGMLHAFACRR